VTAAPAIPAPPAIGTRVRVNLPRSWAHARAGVVEAVVGERVPEVERTRRPDGREVVRRRPAGEWGWFIRARLDDGSAFWGWIGGSVVLTTEG
jgi:hypothetical protein